jgi:hypothetical protein
MFYCLGGLLAIGLLASWSWADGVEVAVPATQPASPTTRPTTQPTDPKVAALVQQLGSDDFRARQSASEALGKMGKDAAPAIKEALASDNPEIRTRAQRLLKQLEDKDKPQEANAANPNNQPFGPNGGVFIVPRGAHVQMRVGVMVQGMHGVSESTISINGNTYKCHQDDKGLKLTVTENGQTKEYTAKSPAELKEKQPEAYKVYEKYFNNINQRAMIQIMPAPAPVPPVGP